MLHTRGLRKQHSPRGVKLRTGGEARSGGEARDPALPELEVLEGVEVSCPQSLEPQGHNSITPVKVDGPDQPLEGIRSRLQAVQVGD